MSLLPSRREFDRCALASFQEQDWMHLQFPAKMYIDYVRVYQRSDVSDGTTCDPPNYPTADYISKYAHHQVSLYNTDHFL